MVFTAFTLGVKPRGTLLAFFVEEPTVHPTGSEYCRFAWGGQAATVGLAGIAPFPTNSCLSGLPVTSKDGL